ncbi:hypothetical protein WAI453_003605 [Rhynchosporium graminicola]|uniref:2EXR domain-containing protein n=1 Tax=Rhynchosporium graminicola TaxID=2792576 RepID=A0A1E1JZU9_9HELO|nr:uncharacterized protein RCO7_01575 [Rhynchosporium commune]
MEFDFRPCNFVQFERLPKEIRRMIYAISSDRDPDVNLYAPEKLLVRVFSELFSDSPRKPQYERLEYKFSLVLVNRQRASQVNFVNRETYREYLDRYPNFLQLRWPLPGVRSSPIRFNARIDTIQMDVPSLFAITDVATPLDSATGVGGNPGQGSPIGLNIQQLRGFDWIQKLEVNIQFAPDDPAAPIVPPLIPEDLFGIQWLRTNILTGLLGPMVQNDTIPNDMLPNTLLREYLSDTYYLYYSEEEDDNMFWDPDAFNVHDAYMRLDRNRHACMEAFFKIRETGDGSTVEPMSPGNGQLPGRMSAQGLL